MGEKRTLNVVGRHVKETEVAGKKTISNPIL
jgi:hypothetical protein